MYTAEEIAFMQSIGLELNFENLSGDDYILIEDTVGDWLVLHELDEDYNPSPIGEMCEDILYKIP